MDVKILEVIDDAVGIRNVAKGVVNGKVFTARMVLYEPTDRFSWHVKTEGEFSGVERMAVGKALWRDADCRARRVSLASERTAANGDSEVLKNRRTPE